MILLVYNSPFAKRRSRTPEKINPASVSSSCIGTTARRRAMRLARAAGERLDD